MIRVFIGFDERETVAAHVLAHSIQRHTTEPVSIAFLAKHQLEADYWRKRDANQSTDFAYTRFLVPYLCNYQGRAIFMDCDMLCRSDIAELWNTTARSDKAVHVVKHDYTPKLGVKFLKQPQTVYPRKNWSSLMVFNNPMCDISLMDVNHGTGLFLHRFEWLDDQDIGGLPVEWNHLVGEYEPNPDAKLVHFTRGGPYFKEYEHCEFSDEWFAEFERMCHCEDPSRFCTRTS